MIKKKKTGAHLAKNTDVRQRSRETEYEDRDSFLAVADNGELYASQAQDESPAEIAEEAPKAVKRARHEKHAEEPEEISISGITNAGYVQETAEEARERRRKNKKGSGGSSGIVVLIVLLVAVIMAGVIGYLGYRVTNSPDNLPNVYVNDIFVGGLTQEQTAQVLDEYKWDEATKDSLKVELLKGVTFEVGMCESGVMMTKENAVAAAYRYGHTGNWFENFLTYASGIFGKVDVSEGARAINSDYIRGLVDEALKKQDEVTADEGYQVDEEKAVLTMMKGAGQIRMDPDAVCSAVVAALESGQKNIRYTTLSSEPRMPDFQAIYDELAIEPRDAYYDYDTKSIVDNVDGFQFDVKAAEDTWKNTAIGESFSVPVKITVPEVTRESLEALLFRDVLGSQITTYSLGDQNRCNNLHLAISKIDGIILNPGEVFSYNDTIGQRTEEAGFKPAGAYDDGQVVQEIGGGVCQVSSTLYSATIFAQLKAIERTNHYFKVDYLDYGMDATVSWPTPNFRFENTRDYPVKIHAYYNDEYDYGVGAIEIEILGTDVDGSYVKVWRETWTIGHPEYPWIAIGYSILQHRDVYSADDVLMYSDCYDYLDEYYFHEEVYAEKLAQAEAGAGEFTGGGDGGGDGGGSESSIDFG